MIPLKVLKLQARELKIEGDVLGLCRVFGTLGRIFSIILMASPKFKVVTSICISIEKVYNLRLS